MTGIIDVHELADATARILELEARRSTMIIELSDLVYLAHSLEQQNQKLRDYADTHHCVVEAPELVATEDSLKVFFMKKDLGD